MIEWEATDTGIRAVDEAKTDVIVATTGWEAGGSARDVGHPVDETVTGTVERLRLPPVFTTLTDVDRGAAVEVGTRPGSVSLDGGEYLLHVNAGVKTYVRFPGPAELAMTAGYDELVIRFPERTPVTLGFRSRLNAPEETMTVPASPDGLATALTHASAALRTTGTERSYPTLRSHPPLFEFGDAAAVPAGVSAETPDTGIELRVPPSLRTLFVAAPLAYYLGAGVTVEADRRPVLAAPAVDVRQPLDEPSLVDGVPALLARVFWLDCLVRNVGPYGGDVVEFGLLDRLDLDAEAAYEADPAERLRAYLGVSFDRVADDLPEWHLAMHVEPTLERAPTLPYLLDRLSLVYPPETEELAGRELMERSLDDFYRSGTPGDTPTIDVVKPKLRRGRVHGWMAEGTPIDVFKALPAAYTNRFDYLGRSDDRLSVTVVLNDDAMALEQSDVADVYRERSADLPMDVSLRYGLSTDELADVFTSARDFVHFIGHCEVGGLRCPDGNLSIADLEESNVQTFFLNACGSYYEGLELVRKGSVAGAVTFRKVLDRQAATVGTAFARLLVHGFCIERATRLARRRIMMGKDYTVVGDGTHRLADSDNLVPVTAELESIDGETFRLVGDGLLPETTGGYYQLYVPGGDAGRLLGNPTEHVLGREDLVEFLERAAMPVVYDGAFHWSDELADIIG